MLRLVRFSGSRRASSYDGSMLSPVTVPIIWSDVVAIAPELAVLSANTALDLAEKTAILEYVNQALNARVFRPEALRLARMNLAAHIATVSINGALRRGAGPIASESVGGISRTFAAISTAARGGALVGTLYGEFMNYLVETSRARLPRVL